MTKTMLGGVLAATLVAALSGVAVAGAKWGNGVYIDLKGHYAMGGLGASRNSADTQQYIGCYSYSGSGWNVGICIAVSASGQVASCQTTNNNQDPAVLDQIRALNGDSHLYFAWDDNGVCTTIQSENFSMYEPKK